VQHRGEYKAVEKISPTSIGREGNVLRDAQLRKVLTKKNKLIPKERLVILDFSAFSAIANLQKMYL
jgi:hypothetical protein